MKKGILLAFMAAVVMAGNAQVRADKQLKQNNRSYTLVKKDALVKDNSILTKTTALPAAQKALTKKAPAAKGPRKVLDNGVYYDRPAGTYFLGWTEDWLSYYSWHLFGAPIEDNLYVNRCSSPEEAQWSLVTSNGTYDLSDEVDEDNNLPWGDLTYDREEDTDSEGDNPGYLGFGSYYVPTITVGDTEYTFGEENVRDDGTVDGAVLSIAGRPQPMTKKLCEGAYSYFSDGNGGYDCDIYGSNSWLDIDTDDDGETEEYRVVSLFQFHEKPILPMYVENIILLGRTSGKDGALMTIAEGHPVVISIYNITRDEEGHLQVGDSLIAELTCTQADAYPVSDNGQVFGYNMVFANKSTNIFGMEVVNPFVLDQAYALVVKGFADEGNAVVLAADERDEDTDDQYSDVSTGMHFTDVNGNPTDEVRYYRNVTLTPQFTAMFDCVKVYDTLYNSDGDAITMQDVITVPAEGGNTFEIEPASDDETCVAYVQTFLDWLDEEESENYFIEDLPDWVSDYYYDETYRERYKAGESVRPFTFIGFEVEPLPEDEEGRYAEVHITSMKGAVSKPIIIKQGNVDIHYGISNAKTTAKQQDSAIYNINGQRVAKATKGIYVKNGKKFIVK